MGLCEMQPSASNLAISGFLANVLSPNFFSKWQRVMTFEQLPSEMQTFRVRVCIPTASQGSLVPVYRVLRAGRFPRVH